MKAGGEKINTGEQARAAGWEYLSDDDINLHESNINSKTGKERTFSAFDRYARAKNADGSFVSNAENGAEMRKRTDLTILSEFVPREDDENLTTAENLKAYSDKVNNFYAEHPREENESPNQYRHRIKDIFDAENKSKQSYEDSVFGKYDEAFRERHDRIKDKLNNPNNGFSERFKDQKLDDFNTRLDAKLDEDVKTFRDNYEDVKDIEGDSEAEKRYQDWLKGRDEENLKNLNKSERSTLVINTAQDKDNNSSGANDSSKQIDDFVVNVVNDENDAIKWGIFGGAPTAINGKANISNKQNGDGGQISKTTEATHNVGNGVKNDFARNVIDVLNKQIKNGNLSDTDRIRIAQFLMNGVKSDVNDDAGNRRFDGTGDVDEASIGRGLVDYADRAIEELNEKKRIEEKERREAEEKEQKELEKNKKEEVEESGEEDFDNPDGKVEKMRGLRGKLAEINRRLKEIFIKRSKVEKQLEKIDQEIAYYNEKRRAISRGEKFDDKKDEKTPTKTETSSSEKDDLTKAREINDRIKAYTAERMKMYEEIEELKKNKNPDDATRARLHGLQEAAEKNRLECIRLQNMMAPLVHSAEDVEKINSPEI